VIRSIIVREEKKKGKEKERGNTSFALISFNVTITTKSTYNYVFKVLHSKTLVKVTLISCNQMGGPEGELL
jgi:hypothetical protein